MSVGVAFEILYKEYYVRVFGLCRRLLNSASLAEDAAQETFMRAYQNFNRYDTDQPFWHWIASIANNHCVDLLRRNYRHRKLFGDEEDESRHLETEDTNSINFIDEEELSLLTAAISQLPDKYRVPLVLAYFSECSYEQIATDLSISRNHVGVLLLRAKQQLRLSLQLAGERPQ